MLILDLVQRSHWTVDSPCCSALFWLVLGLAFVAAELGISMLLVLLSMRPKRNRR